MYSYTASCNQLYQAHISISDNMRSTISLSSDFNPSHLGNSFGNQRKISQILPWPVTSMQRLSFPDTSSQSQMKVEKNGVGNCKLPEVTRTRSLFPFSNDSHPPSRFSDFLESSVVKNRPKISASCPVANHFQCSPVTSHYLIQSHLIVSVLHIEGATSIRESHLVVGDVRIKGQGMCLNTICVPFHPSLSQNMILEFFLKTSHTGCVQGIHHCCIPIVFIPEGQEKVCTFTLNFSPVKRNHKNFLPTSIKVTVKLQKRTQGLFYSSPKDENVDWIYVGLAHDPLDVAVARVIAKVKDASPLQSDITLISTGKYSIAGRICKLAFKNGVIYVYEGGARQPLEEYLRGSEKEIVWEHSSKPCAIASIPSNCLPNLHDTESPWEATLDRRKAMELACHRAAVREQVALQILESLGRPLPEPLYADHLAPPHFRQSPNGESLPMTYTWDANFTNPRIAVVEGEKQKNLYGVSLPKTKKA